MNTNDWSLSQEIHAVEIQSRELMKKMNQLSLMILTLHKGLRDSYNQIEKTKEETQTWLQEILEEPQLRLHQKP